MSFVDQILPDRPLQIVINPTLEIDPYFSATGKAHLAALNPRELKAWLPARIEPPTRHAVASVEALLEQLEEVRRTGIAADLEERTEGSCAIAVSLQDTDHTVYCVTLITTSARYARDQEQFRRELEETRAAIEHSLGGCGPDQAGRS
jgi:DNA-binding IclR family transcriptional regulator